MNYRLILLDYFYQYLNLEGVKYASFCFLEKTYSNNLSKAFFDNQMLSIYHVKPPRVFNKEYSFSNAEGTILDFVMELKTDITFNYEEIDSLVKDVYYLKSIKNIDFKYLHIRLLEINEFVSLVLFAYSNKETLNIKQSDLNKLYKTIIKDEEEYLKNTLNALIVNNTFDYIIDVDKGYYLSDSIQKKLGLNSNYFLKENKDRFKKIKKEIDLFNKLNNIYDTLSIENKNIYFYNIKENVDLDIIHDQIRIYSLKDLLVKKFNNDYTLIFLQILNENAMDYRSTIKYVLKYFKENLIDYYEFYDGDDSLLVYLPNIIEQKILEKIKNELTGKIKDLNCVFLNTVYNLGKAVDVNLLVSYLKENQNFDKNTFKEYLVEIKNAEYLSMKNLNSFKDEKYIYNSYEKERIGRFFGYNHENLSNFQKQYYFEHASNEILKEIIHTCNETVVDIYFRINYHLFSSKKIWYTLKQINNNGSKNIILSELRISSKAELNKLIKNIHMLHEAEFNVFFDSSMFSSLMMNDLVSLYDGIYVEDYEMSLGFEREENLFQDIIAYYLRQEKIIILNDNLENKEFSHPKIYLIDEK